MGRDEALRLLASNQARIGEFGVASISLFGSVARDQAGPDSDVDVLVDFSAPPTFDQYMGLKFFLEDLLKRPVDVVSSRTLKDRLRPSITSEAIRVA